MKDTEAIKAISHKFVNKWKYLLGIRDWDIKFRYTKLEDGTYGECSVESAHKSATIVLDIEKHRDKNELLDTARHEMIHIMHAHFDSYRNAVCKHLSPNMSEIADDIFAIGAEDLVRKVENLLDRLDVDVKGDYKE